MAANPNASTQYGAFVPTNFIWDVQQLQKADVKSEEFKELLVRMYQNIGLMALVLNTKDTGQYQLTELVNGQQYFSNPVSAVANAQNQSLRQVYRIVINFGALPNTATKSVAHNITCNSGTTFTRIYATASDTTGLNYVPIPYASTTAVADDIELYVDSTNVNIKTGSNRSNFNVCYVVLEYLKF